MNKIILTLTIITFFIAPNVRSAELDASQLNALSGALNGLLGPLINSTLNLNTTNHTSTTPFVNPINPINNTPTAPATPVVNNTTPTTPVVNNTTPTVPTTPVANNTTPSTPNTPVVNNTNTTTPTPAPNNWYARNDVNMATFPDDCLRIHNEQRMKVAVANLTWSTAIAATAQAWAENMAANGFRHSGRTGENIASSTYSTSTLSRLLGLWVNEQSHFIPGCTYPSCSSTSAEVGHYTQMVWAKTTELGCGFAPGVNKSYNYLCCQYTRAGNVIGQTVYPYPIPTA